MSDYSREGLLNKINNDATYFIAFNTKCSHFGVSCTYCVVENYDLCFYPHRIRDILGCKVEGIPCGNKKNVLALYELIHSKSEYDKYTVRYFVDADFDDNRKVDPHIYVTTCYSIENLFVDKNVVSSILENEYKIRPVEDDSKHTSCLDFFCSELSHFHDSSLLYNSWYHAIKNKGLTKDMKVCLGSTIPSSMINLTIGHIVPQYSITDITAKFPDAPSISEEELEASRAFLLSNPKMFRGKFEMQFLHKFFEYLNSDAKGPRKYTINGKQAINYNLERMISHLSIYVPTPDDMRDYIITGTR